MVTRFVDSNVFVYVLMNDPSFGTKAVRILTRFETGTETGLTSTLALSQVFSHLKKRKKYEEIGKFYEYLDGSPIGITETTRTDLEQARRMGLELNLSWRMWDDLVLAAQMERANVEEIYSNDRDFDQLRGTKRLF